MANLKLKPAASRHWLRWGVSALLTTIALVLLYRAMTGSTLREQKAQAQAQKEAEQLAAKPPGNSESLSAKLDAKRREAEAERDKASGDAATASARAAAASSPYPSSLGLPGAAVPKAQQPSAAPGAGLRLPAGSPGAPSDAEVDAYAASKEAAIREAGKKLASWEAEAEGRAGQGMAGALALGPGMQLPGVPGMSMGAPAVATTAQQPPVQSSAQTLLEAYMRSQQGARDPGSSSEQFRRGVDKPTPEPLLAQPGPGRYSILQGSTIPVVMRVAVSSDIAGPCRAQVTHDVYDSATQRLRLIPAGSSVVCAYNAEVVQGQERLLLAFTRLIFPNGASVALGGMEAADREGAIGAPAEVNTRFWRTFGSAMLMAVVTRAAERPSANSGGITVNTGSSVASTGAGVLADVAKRSLERNMNIKPELRLSPGDLLRLVVNRDLVLEPTVTGVSTQANTLHTAAPPASLVFNRF